MGLETVELILTLEDRFGIRIGDAATERIETVADLQAFIVAELERSGRDADPQRVLAGIRAVLEADFGVPAKLIVPGARIVRDLGLE